MANKLQTYLGFAIKSGKIVYGVDNILKTSKIAVVLTCGLSEKSLKALRAHCSQKYIPLKQVDGGILPGGAKAVGVIDANLAKAIINE